MAAAALSAPERLIHQAEAAALAQTPAWGGLVRGDYSAEPVITAHPQEAVR